ncbi:MAG TPA: peptide chain release factor 1 [Candidatus Limnocylindrales bacterium]|nr:peptide chain release factor 1 [Candidatus Limnocylindrales bacterium]
MLEKLAQIEKRFEAIEAEVADPSAYGNRERFADLMRERADLTEIVETFRRRRATEQQLLEAKAMRDDSDPDIREMAVSEIRELEPRLERLDRELQMLLVPKDPLDQRNAIVEIRAGTGGDEAALFGGDLLRMYLRYCELRGLKVETLGISAGAKGGVKEAALLVSGKDAYGLLKYEGGVHRVQRVPETESQGRIHTSAVTVAVLPEAEEVDIKIEDKDLRIDVYRSSGPGGQSVNTTDSAVRITHIPSGLVVIQQDEKSQHKNKAKALKILRSRLFDLEEAKRRAEIDANRRAMVGTGDRSERIRTYNFPQGRVTDHRIGLTLYSLDAFLGGDMDEMLSALRAHYQAEALKAEAAR